MVPNMIGLQSTPDTTPDTEEDGGVTFSKALRIMWL